MKLEAAANRAGYSGVLSLLIYVNVFDLWTKTSYNTVLCTESIEMNYMHLTSEYQSETGF